MAKLTRYTQKTFGTSDATQNFSQFGGFVANVTTLYSGSTITPTIVQNLSNFLNGWTQAVIGNNAFAIEDFNSICYLAFYQLAYLFQAGIPEYDSGTTYYAGSLCQVSGVIYNCQQTSTGNAPAGSNNAFWLPLFNGGSVYPNLSQGTVTVTSGNALMLPYLTVNSGDTYTVNSGAQFFGIYKVIVNGTLVINGISKIY